MFRKFFSHSNRLTMIAMILVILAGLFGAAFQPAFAADEVNLNIVSVVAGESVTIRVAGMPANKEFRVLMNKIGTQGAGGTSAGTGKTDKDGSFSKTFSIPAALKKESRIAIRIEVTDQTGWYAYNWFTNSTQGSSSTGSSTVSSGSASASSNLTIVDVDEDKSVTVRARNLSANQTYRVWFDWKTRSGAIKSVQAGTVKSDKDGNISTTIKMPSVLMDRNEVRLRLLATSSSSASAFAWFLNGDSDEDTGGGYPAGYTGGMPYLRIGAVVKNETVTVEAYNFPNKVAFEVYMDRMGTQAEDGIHVGSVKAGKAGNDGSFSATFDIPRDLKDREKIAIRLEAADGSGYYAFSWFNNTTAASGQ